MKTDSTSKPPPLQSESERVEKWIGWGAFLAALSCAISIAITVSIIFTDHTIAAKGAWLDLLEPAIMLPITVGLYKKNRFCAVILALWAFFYIGYLVFGGAFSGKEARQVILGFFIIRGSVAVFMYHHRKPPAVKQQLDASFYVYIDNIVQGPFSIEQLKALKQVQTISDQTLCCRLNENDWSPLSLILVGA